MTTPLKPMDREAWEKLLRDFEQFIRVDAADDASYSKGIGPNYGTYADELKTTIVTDILTLQSSNETLTSEVCTLNNRIEEIDRTYNFQREEDAAKLKALQTQLTEALAELERLKGESQSKSALLHDAAVTWSEWESTQSTEASMGAQHKHRMAMQAIEKARQPK